MGKRRKTARNPDLPRGSAVREIVPKRTAKFRRLLSQAKRSQSGASALKRFKKFWGLHAPERLVLVQGGPQKGVEWLTGLGVTRGLLLSRSDKGTGRHGKPQVLRGHWIVAVNPSGKQMVFLSGKPVSGPWRPVGYAPETRYIPTGDLESAGTHKKGRHWVHLHGKRDEGAPARIARLPDSAFRWPRVYADRNGKISPESNFRYGETPSAIVEDWLYG